MRKLVVLTLVGALAASALPSTALAGDPHAVRDRWAGAAIGAAAVVAGAAILHSLATPPAAVPTSGYHPQPPVVYTPPPVVYTPPPVIYTPPPVVYRPPVVYHPPVIYRPPVVIHRHVRPPQYRYWDRDDRRDRDGRWDGRRDNRHAR
jgi:hypothetical protein